MQRIRYIAVAVLSGAVVVFAIQNLQPVTVVFLAWRGEASVTLVIFVPFLSGLAVGGLTAWLLGRGRPPDSGAPDVPHWPPPPPPGREGWPGA